MAICAAFLTIVTILMLTTGPVLADLAGKPTVSDGKTLVIAGQAIVLSGIDAPAADEQCGMPKAAWHCGAEATFALADLIGRTWVTCIPRNRDRAPPQRALCRFGGPKGMDLGLAMVATGWARAVPTHAPDPETYATAEAKAKAAHLGIWR